MGGGYQLAWLSAQVGPSARRIEAQISSKCVSQFVRAVLWSRLTEGNVGLMSRDQSTTGQRTSWMHLSWSGLHCRWSHVVVLLAQQRVFSSYQWQRYLSLGLGSHTRMETSSSNLTQEYISRGLWQIGQFPLSAKHVKVSRVAWGAHADGQAALLGTLHTCAQQLQCHG